MEKLINLDEYPVLPVLDILLQDKTTKENIIWATRSYIDQGEQYSDKYIITKKAIRGEHSILIQPRVFKAVEAQAERTKKKAEVFTPSWIVNKMNNILDEEWFGQKDVFNKEEEQAWTVNNQPLPFGKGKTFHSYIYRRCLEITCGEAPFIVSRYDVATGNLIPIENRIGILDRKLRAINENVDDEDKWIKMAKVAYKSVYGYEFQGDNLLIARINLLLTFVDYYEQRWNKPPDEKLLIDIAKIIAWNFWQMDGLQGSVPLGVPEKETEQLSLFDLEEKKTAPLCRVMNWSGSKSSTLFNRVGKEETMRKWDVIIGNPPYQEETTEKTSNNGQKSRKNVFQHFQEAADQIASQSSILIYPAGRWIHQSGKGLKQFGLSQINDPHLAKIIYFPYASDLFGNNASIADGISIVEKNYVKQEAGFAYEYLGDGRDIKTFCKNPGSNLLPLDPRNQSIISKIDEFVSRNNIDYLHNAILPRSLFGIESDFVSKNSDKVRLYIEGNEYDPNKEVKILTNDKAGKAGRAKWFLIDKNVLSDKENDIAKWKVVVSSANAGGQKRDSQLEIIDNHSAFGRSRVALRMFDTYQEAENFYKYIRSYVVQFAFLLTDEALSSVGKKVPDLINYQNNAWVDFNGNIDFQLCSLLNLSNNEFDYIREYVDNWRSKKKS